MESTKQIRSIRPIRGQKKQSFHPSLQGGAGGRHPFQGGAGGRLFPNQARSATNQASLRAANQVRSATNPQNRLTKREIK